MTKIYTRTGDKGETSLVGGERVKKTDARLSAYGTVDELNANIAYLRDNLMLDSNFRHEMQSELDELLWVQTRLMIASALLASDIGFYDKLPHITDQDIARLEKGIDRMNEKLKPLTHFVIPGGDPLVSLCHISRTVCRRAEREALRAAAEVPIADSPMVFLNRLSDYLYVLSRFVSLKTGAQELYWDGK